MHFLVIGVTRMTAHHFLFLASAVVAPSTAYAGENGDGAGGKEVVKRGARSVSAGLARVSSRRRSTLKSDKIGFGIGEPLVRAALSLVGVQPFASVRPLPLPRIHTDQRDGDVAHD